MLILSIMIFSIMTFSITTVSIAAKDAECYNFLTL